MMKSIFKISFLTFGFQLLLQVFQRRKDATVEFYQSWEEYKSGFGYVGRNFWMGNTILFRIINQDRYELLIDLEDFNGSKKYAKYDHFRVGNEESNYVLAIGNYTAGTYSYIKVELRI